MYVSEKQKIAINMIKEMNKREPERMFTLGELPGITMHTIDALFSKGVLEHIPITVESPIGNVNVNYYKWTGKELE